jgi:YD repeat-containing protein
LPAHSPQATSYAYDANDRLLSESGAVSASYSYDAQGNTLGKQDASGATTYAYNDANRLIEAITPHAALAYAYTADGLRARQTVTAAAGSPITTQYVHDTAYPYAQVIEEYTAEGANPRQLAATFTFADELISQTRYDATGIPATTFVQADGFGSTRWLTDGTGQITDSIDFDAFGNEIARSGTTDLEHLYRGERWDANLAAYDLRARLYTPSQRKVPDPGQLCRVRQRPTQPAQVRLHPQRPGQRHRSEWALRHHFRRWAEYQYRFVDCLLGYASWYDRRS